MPPSTASFRSTGESGAYIREHFFGPDPRLQPLVEHFSDDDLRRLREAVTIPRKVYAAYRSAMIIAVRPPSFSPRPSRAGRSGRLRGAERHPSDEEDDRGRAADFRDRLELPITTQISTDGLPRTCGRAPIRGARISDGPPEALGGSLPSALGHPDALDPRRVPFRELLAGSGDKFATSTTSAFIRLLRNLLRDPEIGRVSSRSFPTRRALSEWTASSVSSPIYTPFGQRYVPVDADLLLSYPESTAARFSKKELPRRDRWLRSSRRPPRMPPRANRPFRSTSSTRCSVSTASGI